MPGVKQSPTAISSLLERCSVDDELGHVSASTPRQSHDRRRYSQEDSGDEEVDFILEIMTFQLTLKVTNIATLLASDDSGASGIAAAESAFEESSTAVDVELEERTHLRDSSEEAQKVKTD